MAFMKTMTATEASRHFSDLLDAVERGETITIVRDRPCNVTYPNVRKCRICWWESMTILLVGSTGHGRERAGQEEPGQISFRRRCAYWSA
jgi:hypothetical protein